MKAIQITHYRCEICGHAYDTAGDALNCESRPVSHDRGVRVGDTVRVTRGDGAGSLAIVERITIIDRDWGHYQWDRYWHTVALDAKLVDGSGHRFLTFDSYEIVRPGAEER